MIKNSLEYVRKLAGDTQPALAYDGTSDFYKWREAAKKKLEELLCLPFEKCDDEFKIIKKSDFEEYTRFDFEFQSEPGYTVSSSFLVPKGAEEKLPAVICIQGHSTGMHISLGDAKFTGDDELIAGGRDFALRAVREGCCAVTIDQRYMGTAGSDPETGHPACSDTNAAMPTLLMGRTAAGERVWDIKRLIDVITANFAEYIDVERIICMGNSGGGTATFYASCLDDRIYMSVPSCALCTFEASVMAMWHCPCNFIPGIRKYFNMGDAGCMIAPKKLVVVCGKDDDIFPLDGVRESFEIIKNAYCAIGKEDLCRLVIGDGGHQFYPDDAWPVIHELMGKG